MAAADGGSPQQDQIDRTLTGAATHDVSGSQRGRPRVRWGLQARSSFFPRSASEL
jgi:hypothetical protein